MDSYFKVSTWISIACVAYHIAVVSGETTYVVAFLGQAGRGHTNHANGTVNINTTNAYTVHHTDVSLTYTVVMTNRESIAITVNITGKNGQLDSLTIPRQNFASVEFNSSHSLYGTEHANKSLTFVSNGSFTLQTFVHNHNTSYTEGFLGIPIEALMGPHVIEGYYEYIVASACGSSGYCQLALAAVECNTEVSLSLPPSLENIVLCIKREFFHTKYSRRITLQPYFAVQIETTQDLSGTRLYSRKPFVVFVGARNLTRDAFSGHVVEQLLPASNWGHNYFVRSLRTSENGDFIKIAANWGNTTVNMTGYPVFKIAHFTHVISRRVGGNQTLLVRASKPIQIIQFSDLAGNSSSGKFSPGMVVLRAVQQRAGTVVGYCQNHTTFQLFMPEPFQLPVQSTPYFTENIFISSHRYVMAGLNQPSPGLYNFKNKQHLGGVVRCGDSAIMSINYPHQGNGPASSPTTSSTAPRDSADTCIDGIEAMTSPDGRAHEVDISAYKRIRVRVHTEGHVMFKFYQISSSTLTNDTSWTHVIMFEAGPGIISVVNCSTGCVRIRIDDLFQKSNAYHKDIKWTEDVTSYWFSVRGNGTRLCGGPGPIHQEHQICVELMSFKPNRLAMIGVQDDAYFNYDLENLNCKHRKSAWRCVDLISNCTAYPVSLCNDIGQPEFAGRLCPKYCRKCTPDSSGRDFRVALPLASNSSTIKECKVFVLSTESRTNVSVGTSKRALLVTRLNDKYFSYDCMWVNSSDVIFITSNRDITVMVIISTMNGAPTVLTPYPTDTFGSLHTSFSDGSPSCYCNLLSESGASVEIEFSDINGTTGWSKLTLRIKPSKFVTIRGNASATCNLGRKITATRPISVFCGNIIGDVGNRGYYQLLPDRALGKHFHTPKLSLHTLSRHVNATIIVQGIANSTRIEMKNASQKQHIVNKTIDGHQFSWRKYLKSLYDIKSDKPIIVGMLLEDSSSNQGQLIILPPIDGYATNTCIGLPLSYLKSTIFNVSDVTTYAVTSNGTLKYYMAPMNDSSMMYDLQQPGTQHFSVTVLTGDRIWFLIPLPGRLFNHWRQEVDTIPCVTSFPVIGDNIDNDCDGLVDEEICAIGYGVMATDSDQDGVCNEDCSAVSNPDPIVKPPKMPHCFPIPNSHLTSCWAPCKCPCSWKTNLDNFSRLSTEERDQYAANSDEKFKELLQVTKESLTRQKNSKLCIPDHRVSAKGIGFGGVGLIVGFLAIIVILDMKSLVNAFWITYDNISSLCTSDTPRHRRMSRVEPTRRLRT